MTIDIIGEKIEFRQKLKRKIASLDENFLGTSNHLILQNVLSLPEIQNCERILIYCSMGREIDTRQIIEKMFVSGKTVALPVCEGDGIMHFSVLSPDGPKIEGMYGIMEPEKDAQKITPRDGDIIVVPGLTFDRQGYRMGKGSGYYDRFLTRQKFISVGLARDCLIYDDVPREAHDMKVNILVTDKGIKRL